MEKPLVDVPRLRPRIGGGGGEIAYQRAPRFCQSVLIRAQRRFARVSGLGPPRPPRKLGTRGVADVLHPRANARRCVVKAHIAKLTGRGMAAARAHLAYIERDGVERDGSAGQLYGAGKAIDPAVLTEAIEDERHQFRFIVSPEDEVDLTAFTRDLMYQVERDLALKLQWGAVNHYDTDNPHVHLVVRGVDQDGRQVWIDRAYITERMRWQAQHLLTNELGPRPEHEIERQLDREVNLERLTSVDRRLAAALGPDQTTAVARLAQAAGDRERRRLVGRLQVLETMRLAERTAAGAWRLDANWEDALRELGERNDIIKRVHRAMGDGAPLAGHQVIDGSVERAPIEGVVRRKGLHDELRGDIYAVVETPAGRAAYARLDPVSSEKIAEGAIVKVAVEKQTWAKPMDRAIEQIARDNGGVYDPRAHFHALQRRPVVINGRAVSPEETVAANVRRLARLERHKLAERVDEERWRVPSDLVRSLEARDVTHPRRLVRAETVAPPLAQQVALRAPCWLDRQDPAAARASHGHGAEVRAALAARAGFLAALGVPGEPREQRIRALERLEQVDISRRLAAQHGVTLMPAPVRGMRGELVPAGQTAAGVPLVGILDGPNRRLAVTPAPPDAAALLGRRVTVGRDAAGALAIRREGRGREM
jgi:type IV secretory pathway VirD2 relaxase